MFDQESRNQFNKFHELLNKIYHDRNKEEIVKKFIDENIQKFKKFKKFIGSFNDNQKYYGQFLSIIRHIDYFISKKNDLHESYNNLYKSFVKDFLDEYKENIQKKRKYIETEDKAESEFETDEEQKIKKNKSKKYYLFTFNHENKAYIKYSTSSTEYNWWHVKRQNEHIVDEKKINVLKAKGKFASDLYINFKRQKKVFLYNNDLWQKLIEKK